MSAVPQHLFSDRDPYRLGIYPYKPPINHDNELPYKRRFPQISLDMESNKTEKAKISHFAKDIAHLRQGDTANHTTRVTAASIVAETSLESSTMNAVDDPRSQDEQSSNPTKMQNNEMTVENSPSWNPLVGRMETTGMLTNTTNATTVSESKPKHQIYPSWPEPSWPDLSQYFYQSPKATSDGAGGAKESQQQQLLQTLPPQRKLEFIPPPPLSFDATTLQDLFSANKNLSEVLLNATELQTLLAALSQLTLPEPTQLPLRGIVEGSVLTKNGKSNATLGMKERGAVQTTIMSKQSSSTVAFPQPSTLDVKCLRWGTTVASSIVGFVVGASILPNLWLMGSVLGGFYGYGLGRQLEGREEPFTSFIPLALVNMGRRLAKAYLRIYDYGNAIFFMYKTGQLSYEYYKRYASLDQKFAIQSKIDAWNNRFAEGKIAFDKWEKENEVGRKALAFMRTIWLVEEKSKKSLRRRTLSKYRLVQLVYDAAFLLGRIVGSIWKIVSGRGGSEVTAFFNGLVKWDMAIEEETLSSRIVSGLVACVAVSFVGVLFSIAPVTISIGAIIIGLFWPTWYMEISDSINRFWDERIARGRGESSNASELPPSSGASKSLFGRTEHNGSNRSLQKRVLGPLDRKRYHYYKLPNGRKKFYRVGNPWFSAEDIMQVFQQPVEEKKRFWWARDP